MKPRDMDQAFALRLSESHGFCMEHSTDDEAAVERFLALSSQLLDEMGKAETPYDYRWLLGHYSCACDPGDTAENPCPRQNLHRAENLGAHTVGVIRNDHWARFCDPQEQPDSAYRFARAAAHFALLHLAHRPTP